MRRTTILVAVAMLAACAVTREGKLAQMQTTYAHVATSLVTARTAGKINDEAWARVKVADRLAYGALVDYKDGRTTREAVLSALAELEKFLIQEAD